MADSYEIAKGHVTIDTKYDGRRINRRSYFAGQRAGTWFHRGFQYSGLRRFNKMWSVFFKPLNNLKKWLTRLRMPAIFAGLLGSALTLIPTLTQLGSVVGVGMLPAFLSWATTIGIVRALLGNLGKSIKSQLMKQIDDAADSIKKLAQETAKPGLNAFFEEAIEHAPILNKYVKEIATGISDVGFSLAAVLDKDVNIQRIRDTLDGTSRATRMWYSVLDEAAEVLIALASSGTPLFERFTKSMVRVAHTIHDWIMLQKATGALDRYLSNAYETLEKFGRGGRDFLIGLFNIINGGVFGTEKVADSFERWGASFRRWSEDSENVDKVRKVIQWFTDHVGQFFRFAAAATAVQLALTGISRIKGMALFVRTLFALGPAGFILFGIGAALSSLAGGFVFAYTHSEVFREKLHKLVGEISGRLAPIFKDWWAWAKRDLLPLLEQLAVRGIGELGKAIHGLLDVVDDNKAALAEWRPVILFLIKALSYLTGFAIKGFIEELSGLITIVGWVGRGIGALRLLFRNLPHWIGTAIDAVVGYFSTLKERAGRTVDATATAFRELPGKIVRFLKSLPGALIKSLNAAFDGMIYLAGWGTGKIIDFFVRLPGRVITTMNAFWDRLYADTKADIGDWVDFFARLPGRVMRWFDRTWDSAYDTTVTWFGKIKKFISELPGKVGDWLVNLGPKVKKRFSDSWDGAKSTSNSKVKALITWVSKIPGRAWTALVKLKNRIVDRFASGWAAATGTSKTKVAAIINFILGIPGRAFYALRKLAGQLKSRASTAWQSFRDESGRKVVSFITWVSQIPGRVVRGLGKIGTKLKESGRQLIQGLLVGVKARISEIGGLGGWFKANLVDPVVGAVKRFFQIKSPSRVFQGIGKYLVAGLWKGVASSSPRKMIGKIFGGMDDALVAMVEKGLINIASLPQNVMKKVFGIFDDLMGGGGGSAGGLVGFARMAWSVFSKLGLAMGGWRARGSVPGSDHPKGKAIDIMTGSALMHRLIIEMGKRLPGAKYWISMRRIALAREGWRSRPYHGPNPHTDHVHWSFFRQGRHGRGLPEDVWGLGARSGQGYVMHRGEQVLRQGETRIGHQGAVNHYHFAPGSIVIDPANVREFNQVIDMVTRVRPTARMAPRPTGAR